MKILVPTGFGEDRDEDGYGIDSSDEELLDTNNGSGSVLSATAEPFVPSNFAPENDSSGGADGGYVYIENDIAIYNDGVPCLTMTTEKDRRDILNGINDEAFIGNEDDPATTCFPLDANDAAELEEMDAFVMEMANLSFLEEREEQARASFSHVQKRWEVRRQKGASHRGPHPRMNLIVPSNHNPTGTGASKTPPPSSSSNSISSIIAYSHALHAHEERMRDKEVLATSASRRGGGVDQRHVASKNNVKHIRRPIQQPRKEL
jgi:hypothetical protein